MQKNCDPGKKATYEGFFEKVYEIVAQIPEGCVITYGQIARLLSHPTGARLVGWAMRAAPPGRKLPCHRVVNSQGTLAPPQVFGDEGGQRRMLEKEGVTFLEDGRIHLKKHLWLGSL